MTKRYLSILTGTLLTLDIGRANAGSNDPWLIKDVLISSWNNCSFVQIHFNVPVSYSSHSPMGGGDELQIEFEAITTKPTEWKTVFERRVVDLPPQEVIPLVEIVYEKDFEGDRKLMFSFSQPMHFIVGQQEDFNLLVVSVAEPDATPCPPP